MNDKEYKTRLADLKAEYEEKKRDLNRTFVKANTRFKVGDTIESLKNKGVIKQCSWDFSFSDSITVYYKCQLLKKDGTEFKRENIAYIKDVEVINHWPNEKV